MVSVTSSRQAIAPVVGTAAAVYGDAPYVFWMNTSKQVVFSR